MRACTHTPLHKYTQIHTDTHKYTRTHTCGSVPVPTRRLPHPFGPSEGCGPRPGLAPRGGRRAPPGGPARPRAAGLPAPSEGSARGLSAEPLASSPVVLTSGLARGRGRGRSFGARLRQAGPSPSPRCGRPLSPAPRSCDRVSRAGFVCSQDPQVCVQR